MHRLDVGGIDVKRIGIDGQGGGVRCFDHQTAAVLQLVVSSAAQRQNLFRCHVFHDLSQKDAVHGGQLRQICRAVAAHCTQPF